MADEDEIDVLGDFSFNSCFAQNNQGINIHVDTVSSCQNNIFIVRGQNNINSLITRAQRETTQTNKLLRNLNQSNVAIHMLGRKKWFVRFQAPLPAITDECIPILLRYQLDECRKFNSLSSSPSCSNREDTVHPQWLLDSTEANWYDRGAQGLQCRSGPSRRLIGDKNVSNRHENVVTRWTQAERSMLVREMAKYGRNIKKISQAIKTKTEVEIQTLIDAEYGLHIDTTPYGLENYYDHKGTPTVVQEEVVTHTNIKKVINPPLSVSKHPFRKKTFKNSLLNPDSIKIKPEMTRHSEIFYDNDMIIGSTESVSSDFDLKDVVSKNIAKYHAKVKAEKKIGNHRRKVSRNYDTGRQRNRSKDLLLKSPQGRQRKDSSLSDDSVRSPKMQIVLGSGVALPVSEGEQVIKIEKKKDSEPESDIEIDVDSDNESGNRMSKTSQVEVPPKQQVKPTEEPIAVPLPKFEPMPRRQKKINLDGGGGYTIMHTEAGDLYAVGAEPRRERQPRKQPIHLIRCRVYNAAKPAPYDVRLHVSTLILMDAHGHSSRGEVMGLAGGELHGRTLTVSAYRPAAAAACSTHCDMDPVSQSHSAEQLTTLGLSVCGWHHSHPTFPCAPSALDLATQRSLQTALEWGNAPLLGFITSQHWPPGRAASQYRCLRVEEDESGTDAPVGYKFSVKLVADVTAATLPGVLRELRTALRADDAGSEFSVDMTLDVCPQAKITYLEKCISSISHHMRSAGYSDDDAITRQLIQGLRDVFR